MQTSYTRASLIASCCLSAGTCTRSQSTITITGGSDETPTYPDSGLRSRRAPAKKTMTLRGNARLASKDSMVIITRLKRLNSSISDIQSVRRKVAKFCGQKDKARNALNEKFLRVYKRITTTNLIFNFKLEELHKQKKG